MAQKSRQFITLEISQLFFQAPYFERPVIAGRGTWRRLLPVKNLKLAREEYYRRRNAVARGEDP